ncbi:unnamed protein product, partial [Mesorhabditis belari]|uniref:LITAF domain-containing protein n=1 Tax=Mesorhabditis belari TaxID=2138241 RepID=A0AAF3EUQ6_9BILA
MSEKHNPEAVDQNNENENKESTAQMPPPPPYPEATSGVYPSVPTPNQGAYPTQPNPGYPQQGYSAYPPNPQPNAPMGVYPPYPYPAVVNGVDPSATVITVQPTTVVLNHHLGPYPCSITCPNCHQTAVTEVIYQAGLFAWLICGIMFIFGFWCCCCIPFCVDSCQDAEHRCRNCRHYIGTYKRM